MLQEWEEENEAFYGTPGDNPPGKLALNSQNAILPIREGVRSLEAEKDRRAVQVFDQSIGEERHSDVADQL